MTDVAPAPTGAGGAALGEDLGGPPLGAIPADPMAGRPAAVPDGTLGGLPMEALHDVELNVEVVLGRARMPLRDLLVAHPGTTIELDRAVHSTVDVMVNGTLFARGEMVVVDDSEIGVQITEVIGVEMSRGGRA